MPDEQPHDDLPPRTWRHWWRQTPSGFRIGVWGFATLVVLHLALAVRIAIGLVEPPEVTWLRERNASIHYLAELWHPLYSEPLSYSLIVEGLAGRSCSNVDYIGLANATKEDLIHIGTHFPNVRHLCLYHADIMNEGITSLFACRRLETLELQRSTIDDDTVKSLSRFDHVRRLDLSGTLVTDAAIPYLSDMNSLREVDFSHTRISLEAIQSWRARHSPGFLVDTEKDSISDELFSFLRWSDGEYSASFGDPIGFTIDFKGPKSAETWDCSELDGGQFNYTQPSRDQSWDYYIRWTASRLLTEGDGEYHFQLNIGDVKSEPVVIQLQDGKASTHHPEFRMPITRAQAEAILEAQAHEGQ